MQLNNAIASIEDVHEKRVGSHGGSLKVKLKAAGTSH